MVIRHVYFLSDECSVNMNIPVKHLGLPLVELPPGELASVKQSILLLHGYHGGKLKGFRGFADVTSCLLLFNFWMLLIWRLS